MLNLKDIVMQQSLHVYIFVHRNLRRTVEMGQMGQIQHCRAQRKTPVVQCGVDLLKLGNAPGLIDAHQCFSKIPACLLQNHRTTTPRKNSGAVFLSDATRLGVISRRDDHDHDE